MKEDKDEPYSAFGHAQLFGYKCCLFNHRESNEKL